VICIHHVQCNSETCPHKIGHPENDFCKNGSCSWGEDTHCVPETKREQLAALMMLDKWSRMTDAQAIDAIMEIFGEEKEEENND